MRCNILLTVAGLAMSMAAEVLGKPIVVGYYPSWKRQYMASVDFSKYTHINLSFGIPTSSGTFSFDGDWFVPQVVTQMHAVGTKVLLTVGGWSGSNYFSTILKTPSARSTLISSMVSYVKTNGIDGIDIDWEYPGRLGDNCNVFDPANDATNFLSFLQDLRAAFDTNFGVRQKLITLALRVQPFDGPNGPISDVSGFAKVVDYANLMQYDINGGWNNVTGPNAPLNFEKGKGLQVSFVSAIDDWTKAGWPANQLNAGLGFYGHSTTALVDMTKDPTNQYQPQSTVIPLGDSEDGSWWDSCAGSGGYSGTWQYKHLRDQGVLSSPTTAAAPWVRQWDPVSQTPWVFNPTTKIFISYDDPQSLQVKVNYAASKGLAGAMVWTVNMDYNNELMNVIQSWPGSGQQSSSSAGTTSSTASSSTATTSTASSTSTSTSSAPATSTTSAQATSTTSASASTTSATSGGGSGPVAGGACSTEGAYQCADTTGKNANYFLCLYGKWVGQACGSGTACFQSGTSVTCNWPSA